MKSAACLAVAFALLVALQGEPASAQQADAHARALARATCQSGKQTEAVTDATAALERDPNELGPRMRLADALVDQGCYQEAVDILEAGQQAYPRNSELAGKLRDVRSLVTEQTYIEGLTQAAEGAKLQRNQLRCTRLADVTACDDALKSKPEDEQLLIAKGDALMQANHPADAAAAYRHASQLKPADEPVKTKLAAAEALIASTTPPPEPTPQLAAANTAAGPRPPKRAPGAAAPVGTGAGTVANAGAAAGTVANTGAAARGGRPPTGNVANAGSAAGTVAGGVANAGAVTGTAADAIANTGSARGRRPATGPATSASSFARAQPASGNQGSAATLAAGTPTRALPGAQSSGGQHLTTTPLATIAALEPQDPRTYSNDAPPGRTN